MKAHMRRLLRRIVIQTLWWSGMTRLLRQRLCADGCVVVLMLHRVLSDSEKELSNSEATMVVGDRVYSGMIQYIRKYYRLVDASEPFMPFDGDRLGIALTFDDGWADNYAPLLRDRKEHGVPATIFVSPSLTGKTGPFWPEQVRAILHDASESELRTAVESLKPLPPATRQQRIQELAEVKGHAEIHNGTVDQTMDWEQLSELRSAGIEMGSHTLDHEILTSLQDPAQVDWQLAEAKRQIESRWGTCDLLAYPNGNHNDEVVKRAEKVGYRRAFTVLPGVWHRDTHPLRIPRLNITDQRISFGGEFSPAAFEFSVVYRAYRIWRAERAASKSISATERVMREQAGD